MSAPRAQRVIYNVKLNVDLLHKAPHHPAIYRVYLHNKKRDLYNAIKSALREVSIEVPLARLMNREFATRDRQKAVFVVEFAALLVRVINRNCEEK